MHNEPIRLHAGLAMVTAEQACEWAGVSVNVLRRRVATYRIRSKLRFREQEVGRAFGLELPGPRERELNGEVPPAPREPVTTAWGEWVYKLYDEAEVLLYVGVTRNGIARLGQHARSKPWFRRVARVDIEHFDSRAESETRERELIQTAAPLFNVAHRPTTGYPVEAEAGCRGSVPAHRPEYGDVPGWAVPTADPRRLELAA